MLLLAVPAGSAAAKAGLQKDDVVLACNGKEVRTVDEVRALADKAAGQKLTLAVSRNQKPMTVELIDYAYVVMGPLGLLSRSNQTVHEYRIVGEEKIEGEPAVVLEAVPKPGIIVDHLFGRIWVRRKDAGILKIQWNPASVGNYAKVEEIGRRFKMTPALLLNSEYAFEHNGIRFPSRYSVKEIYARKNGARYQRSETEVIYDRYKFFTVETEVIYRGSNR